MGSDMIFIDQDRDEKEITEISSIPRNVKVLVFKIAIFEGKITSMTTRVISRIVKIHLVFNI